MDATLLLIAAGLLIGSVVLSRGIEHMIRRFNAGPAEPNERSRGFREVLERLESWGRERSSRRHR